MWRKLKQTRPWLYEAAEWGMLALSAGAFLLALAAGACLGVVINGFLAAYINTSFIGLFEFYAGRTQDVSQPEQ